MQACFVQDGLNRSGRPAACGHSRGRIAVRFTFPLAILLLFSLSAWGQRLPAPINEHAAGGVGGGPVLVIKTDEAQSLRNFYARLGYKFLDDIPKGMVGIYEVGCALRNPDAKFVAVLIPPLPVKPWPPPFMCVHPNPFSDDEAELLCLMASDHLNRDLELISNQSASRTVVCAPAKSAA